MSVVAIKVYVNKIVIGADSFVGFSRDTQLKDEDVKLFKQNGMVVGGVGYATDIALFKLFCRDRKPARADEDAILDFITEFVTWGQTKIKNNAAHNAYVNNTDFMIIDKKRAWYISSGYYLKEITDYRAMGAGANMAQTALYLGKNVKEAIGVACELSIYCEKPVNVFEVRK